MDPAEEPPQFSFRNATARGPAEEEKAVVVNSDCQIPEHEQNGNSLMGSPPTSVCLQITPFWDLRTLSLTQDPFNSPSTI